VAFHHLHGLFRETGGAAVVEPAVESEQLNCDRLKILGALAQRRNLDLDSMEKSHPNVLWLKGRESRHQLQINREN
jgi:hypothetical protein